MIIIARCLLFVLAQFSSRLVVRSCDLCSVVRAGPKCESVLLLQDLLQSCARGGRRRVEDMCYERRRAEACVDESFCDFVTLCRGMRGNGVIHRGHKPIQGDDNGQVCPSRTSERGKARGDAKGGNKKIVGSFQNPI